MVKTTNEEITGKALQAQGFYRVQLASVGNPDFGQDPYQPLYGVENRLAQVSSLGEASRVCREFIREHELGGGNWSGGEVYWGAEVVARISYNGRIWQVEPDPELLKAIQEMRETVSDEYHRVHLQNGRDLNGFSTQGARDLWQGGYDGIRPRLLVDGSGNWRYWARGCEARLLVETLKDSEQPVSDRPKG